MEYVRVSSTSPASALSSSSAKQLLNRVLEVSPIRVCILELPEKQRTRGYSSSVAIANALVKHSRKRRCTTGDCSCGVLYGSELWSDESIRRLPKLGSWTKVKHPPPL